jgi:probable F420-dependent oxidoreductase
VADRDVADRDNVKFAIQHGVGDSRWVPAIISPGEVKRFAQTCERVGVDAISFTDHPAPSNRWVESGGEGVADLFTSLGFCAAVTERVQLLTYVLLPTYRNPFVTAHQVATLDHLSAGRVTVGMGTGYLKSEFYALGVDPDNRRERFEEALAICKEVWVGADVTHEGHGFSARGVRSRPSSVQQPHPPLWLHGNTDWALNWVVREGQGWIGMMISEERTRTLRTRPIPTIEAFAARVDDVRIACERIGRDPSSMQIVNTGIWPMLDIRSHPGVERMRDDVGRLAALGVDWIACNLCGDDADISMDTVEWFGQEIISAGATPER